MAGETEVILVKTMTETKKIIVVAPHPDDETLGCGGTLLKYKSVGAEIQWLIVTAMVKEAGYTQAQIDKRESEMAAVSEAYGFSKVHQLKIPTGTLSDFPEGQLIEQISAIIQSEEPDCVFTNLRHDAHSDHRVTFDATLSACKSFRASFVKRLLAYETVSETEFGLRPHANSFTPNCYESIEGFLDKKLSILRLFESEIGDFPFPRSLEVVEALAKIRGSQCNARAAEAFLLIKEIR